MKAKWMAVLAIALLFSGCADRSERRVQPRIEKVGKDVFFLEVEEFGLTYAEVQELEGASGGKVVVLHDIYGKAEASVQLSKGNYEITVYALGPSSDEDAFYLTVGDNVEERMWPENPGGILPTPDVVNFTQKADGLCDILLRFAEPNVQLDRVQFKHVP